MEKIELKIWKTPSYSRKEAFRTLRTNIQFCGDDIKAIVFTSYGEDEGKSTVVLNLARSVAESGKKVLVIDTDIRKSTMIRELRPQTLSGLSIYGLSHYLSGQKKLDEVLCETVQLENIHIIFSGPFVSNSAELLDNNYMDMLIKYAKSNYDLVLIDAAPLGMVIDAAVIATRSDGAIIVIAQGNCTKRQVLGIKKQLISSRVRILGTVFNKVNTSKKGSSGYRYGQYYGQYGDIVVRGKKNVHIEN